MSKLIVFDVDGTILDSYGLFEKIVVAYSEKNNLPIPCLKTIGHGYGDPDNHDFKWGMPLHAQKHHLHKTYVMTDELSMSNDPAWTPGLFQGVEETLTRLKDDGHTLAIVTAKPEAPLLHLLAYHYIGSLFSAIRSRDDLKKRGEREKPHPDMLLSVMQELNFHPQDTAMIGDTTMDILMGVSANTSTIGVTWGMHPKEHLLGAGAHHIVETVFHDVAPAVKKIFS